MFPSPPSWNPAFSCVIPANSDVTGPGVRLSVYLQFAWALTSTILHLCCKELDEDKHFLIQGGISALVTGTVFIISSIIQAKNYGLAVYHALIILDFCWIMIISAVTPYSLALISAGRHHGCPWREVNAKLLLMLTAFTTTLSFVAAFGAWVFIRMPSFDTNHPNCTHETVTYVFGHYIRVSNPGYRHFWTTAYILASIPILNLCLLTILLSPLTILFLFALRLRAGTNGSKKEDHSGRRQLLAIRTGVSLGPIIYSIMIIVANEKTIRANNVATGAQDWTLGQVFALFGAVIPLLGILLRLCVIFYR